MANLLCVVHLYPPYHLCGAEMMLHQMNKYFQTKGHTIKVLLKQANQFKITSHYVYDDVDVFPPDQYNETMLINWSDAVITHLDYAGWAQALAGMFKKPVFHIIHNSFPREHLYNADRPQFVIYNSNWIADELKYPHNNIVLHPPTDYRYYDTNIDPWHNEYITLINLDQNKGGEILREIAKKLPKHKFLGVKGSYSEPAKIGQILDQPSNVTIMEKQQDIRGVYRMTKILIMPSRYESWGRTATEAMCSGIPVIASPTPGLKENCGNAGIFVRDRDNVQDYVVAIEKLHDEKVYNKWSQKAKIRSRDLDPLHELHLTEQWINTIANDYKYGNGNQYSTLNQNN
jgi:glycosyltransferase involved in cell wall biosynthesis